MTETPEKVFCVAQKPLVVVDGVYAPAGQHPEQEIAVEEGEEYYTDSEGNRVYPTCVVCGGPIKEEDGEVPCWIESIDREDFGEHEGEAYHLNKCEDGIFEEVYAEVSPENND